MGELVYEAALDTLVLAVLERGKRLQAMVNRAIEVGSADKQLGARMGEVCARFGARRTGPTGPEGEAFLSGLMESASTGSGDYLEAVQSLSPDLAAQGSKWLQGVVDGLCLEAETLLQLDAKGRLAPLATE
jgi:hypothetical protein